MTTFGDRLIESATEAVTMVKLMREIEDLRHELAAEKALADRLRGEVCGLWKLLDDIDTLDDACREHDKDFRRRAYSAQRRRFNIVSGEAYDAYRKARGL